MATKKNKQANGGKTAAMAITDFFEQMKSKATNGERVVKLAKERDFLCDRISETEAEYKKCTCAADKKTLAEQLEAMRNYKFHLNIRIKSALDE